MKKINVTLYFYLTNRTITIAEEAETNRSAVFCALFDAKFDHGLSGMYKIINCEELNAI